MRCILEYLSGFISACSSRHEHGATIFEYAIILAIISIAAIVVIALIGEDVSNPFQTAVDAFSAGETE